MFRRSRNTHTPVRQPTRSVAPRESQSVFSYRAARQVREGNPERQLESLQQRQHQGQTTVRRRTRTAVFLAVLVVLFLYVSWLNSSPRVIVLGSAIDKSLLQNTTTYQQAAAKLLGASVANHNKLTIDADGVARKLEQAYPELASVSVQSSLFGHQPQISIEPTAPTLELTTTSGSTFVLAASGKALALANTVTQLSTLHLPVINDQSGLPVHLGSAALPSTDVTFIQTLLLQLQAQHLTTTSLTLPQGTSELDVRISGKPYFIKFNLENSVNQQVGTFLAVNKYLTVHTITPSQYIDVRVAGRAYYL
jgi:hypothetical protein